jgi:hypothetical protein
MAPPLAKFANFPHTITMLNSKKLLYVFSDVAYVAELLPAKKKGDFKIQEFRQINGEFLDNDTFIPENIDKLFSKLDKEEYLLVLPDFFFTNTIVEVAEKAKTKVEKYIEEKLLPSLNLKEETHQIEHFVLTQYGDKSNVQLSAIERSLLSPIFEAAKKHEIKVSKTVSLSWTIKSLISLEPSLSLVQMGENIYLVQHYIGIDQATSAPVTDVEKIAETIKTLKGAEPSIQTVYLLTNELVEERLKELLKSTLPLQQLSDFKDDDSEVPSYVNQVIEAGAKTLSVTDFNVPDFKIEEVDASLIEEAVKDTKKKKTEEEQEEPDLEDEIVNPVETEEDKESDVVTGENEVSEIKADETPLPEPATPPPVGEVITPAGVAIINVPEIEIEPEKDVPAEDDFEVVGKTISPTEKNDDILEIKEENSEVKETMPEEKTLTNEDNNQDKVIDKNDDDKSDALSQFAVVEEEAKIDMKEATIPKELKPGIIKNKTGVNSMLKMVFVSLSVFFLTVGVGVGLGLGYLTISNKDAATDQPEVIAEEVPAAEEGQPEASPTPSPEPEIAKDEIEILIVNATTKAGYAGQIKSLLTADDFENIDAGNAKGDYEEGNYILMKEENSGLIDLISEATDLEFVYSDEIKTEDIQGNYDAVIVLAE